MPPFMTAQLVVGGILLTIAALHFALSAHGIRRQLNFMFALVALFAAGDAFVAPWRYGAETGEGLVLAVKWSTSFQGLFGVTAAWFVANYADRRETWFPKALALYTLAVIALHLVLPYGLLFRALPELQPLQLPWGESIVSPRVQRSPLLVLANVVGFSASAYVVICCVGLWRQGNVQKARILGIAVAPIVLVAYPQGVMINWGLASPPYLYSFTFLGLVLVMSLDLINDSVRTAELSRKVEINERRWRTLLENVQLLVAGCDRAGVFNYVNPFFRSVTGYKQEEILGRNLEEFIPPTHSASVRDLFQRMISGDVQEYSKFSILRKDASQRSIFWSNVVVHDDLGAIAGTLSIGADVTEQVQAEVARDEALRRLEEMRARLEAENVYLKEEVFADSDSPHIIGQSAAIRYVVHKIHEVSKTAATVLIEGETGVGKELVARAVHDGSTRSKGPFIRVNCAALPPSLVESELFGHEKGAFTGADRLRKGRFELADGGTLFLDEVGELPVDIQAKLLRVLQEGEFERVGDSKTKKIDVRIVAATNRNLKREVAAGRYREDLFYRLQIYPITVPPLRERREDIPLLARHFTTRLATRYGKSINEIPGHVMKELSDWDWPGNVRELENVIERAVISSSGPSLAIPRDFGQRKSERVSEVPTSFVSLDEMERIYIRQVLDHTDWKIAGPGGTAEILCLHSNTLRSRMAKLGISRDLRAARHLSNGAK